MSSSHYTSTQDSLTSKAPGTVDDRERADKDPGQGDRAVARFRVNAVRKRALANQASKKSNRHASATTIGAPVMNPARSEST